MQFHLDDDSLLIHATARPLVDAHAKYLAFSRTAVVGINRNADGRRRRDYHLSPGPKRIEALLKSAPLRGVPAGEMEAARFHMERPIDPDHDKTAWTKDRRADLNPKPTFREERASDDQTAAVIAVEDGVDQCSSDGLRHHHGPAATQQARRAKASCENNLTDYSGCGLKRVCMSHPQFARSNRATVLLHR